MNISGRELRLNLHEVPAYEAHLFGVGRIDDIHSLDAAVWGLVEGVLGLIKTERHDA